MMLLAVPLCLFLWWLQPLWQWFHLEQTLGHCPGSQNYSRDTLTITSSRHSLGLNANVEYIYRKEFIRMLLAVPLCLFLWWWQPLWQWFHLEQTLGHCPGSQNYSRDTLTITSSRHSLGLNANVEYIYRKEFLRMLLAVPLCLFLWWWQPLWQWFHLEADFGPLSW